MAVRIPTPDGLLIAVFDRIGDAVQRRGFLLPTVRTPLPFVEVFALGILAILLGDRIAGPYGLLIAFMAIMQTLTGLRSARERAVQARTWSPATAAVYAQEAIWIREHAGLRRGISLVTACVFAALAATAFARIGPGTAATGLSCLVLWSLGRLSEAYAECMLPLPPKA